MACALITGSAKRIGRHIVLFLAKNGWDIIIHYNHSEAEALKLQKEIMDLGRRCELYSQNFLHDEKTQDMFRELEIELLINNASIFKNDALHEIKEEDLLDNLRINFITPIKLSKKMLQNISPNQQINIINILDSIIFKLPKNFISYYFSKMALANFTKLGAKLYAPAARVNGIALGHIMKASTQSEESFNKAREATPLGYSGSIEEICFTIDFIVKTKSLTGQIISLDGGAHLINTDYS